MHETVRIFVGCDPNDSDLEQMMVLEYSVRKHASLPVDIQWMRMSRDPASPWYSEPARGGGWRSETWSTPFSAFRWGVPAYCSYRGRAIYMDADMLVLCDIAELWRTQLKQGAIVAGRPYNKSWRSCVSLWDCAQAQLHMPSLEALRSDPDSHRAMKIFFARHPELIHPLDTAWNSIDGDGRPEHEIRILHYSDMGTQFSHRYSFERLRREGRTHWFDGEVLNHPRTDLAALFDRYYQEALQAGYTPERYRAATPYGGLVKQSQKGYTGNRGKAPHRLHRLLQRMRSSAARA
jgi:hypothetical protein